MGVNKAILIGHLGRDPESRQTANQVSVCTFSLATSERRKDASGNWTDHTEWHRIVSFGKLADFCSNYLAKGRQVYVEGKIRTNKWQDKDGNDRYTTEILADTVQFIGRKGDSPVQLDEDSSPATSSKVMDSLKTADSISDSGDMDFDDDDIPF